MRNILLFLQLLALLLLATRLYVTRLYRPYRFFSAYILFQIARVSALFIIDYRSKLYGDFFFTTEAIDWVLYVLVLLEIFQKALRYHTGIANFSRKALLGALLVATGISMASLLIAPQETAPKYRFLHDFLMVDRAILSSLLLFVMLFMIFLSYFPVPLSRNSKVHATIFATYFFGMTVVFLFRNMMGNALLEMLNVAVHVLTIGCFLAWSFALSKQGEEIQDLSRRRNDPETTQRLMAQLDALNTTLAGSTKR